jgi:hypothetical protein
VQHYPFFVSGGLPTSGTPRGSFPIPRVFPGGLPYPLPPCLSRGESRERWPEPFTSRSGFRKEDLFYIYVSFSISVRLGCRFLATPVVLY